MNKMETEYFRDSWKPDYDKFEYSGWKLLQQIRPKDQILDIGCGGGLLTVPMYNLGGKLTGIDASKKNISVAKIHAKKNNLKINYQILV